MSVAAIIPARKGSKRLPGKNMATLGGVPLVDWTINAAMAAEAVDMVILSSDWTDVLDRGHANGVHILSDRTEDLAEDETPTLDVVQSLLPLIKSDTIVLLEPTTPFRSAAHINTALAMYRRTGADCVVSVCQFGFPPQHGLWLDRDGTAALLTPFFPNHPLETGDLRTQNQAPVHHPNGGIYVTSKKRLEDGHGFFDGTIAGFAMDMWHSIDIDTQDDLDLAELVGPSKIEWCPVGSAWAKYE